VLPPLLNWKVLVLMVEAFIDSLKVAVTLVPVDTLLAALAGDTVVTVGPENDVIVVSNTTSTQ
jgi:hypothetical protein